MSKKIFPLAIVFITCVLFLNIGCPGAKNNRVVAKVNDEVITEAEFIQALPGGFASDSAEQSYRAGLLNQMITKKLFIQEAKKLGLDKEIETVLERDKKSMIIQALYDDIVTKNLKSSKQDIENAKKLLATEVHLKLLIVGDENTVRQAHEEIKQGVPFDSVIAKYGDARLAEVGGDIGFVPIFYIEEPVRNVVVKMQAPQISSPIKCEEDYKIVQLLGKQPSQVDTQTIRANAKAALESEKSRKLASDYLKQLFGRLVYNPEGLSLFYKNVDSITPAEGEIWVVKKDNKKVVYAKNLLHVARQFPNLLDTAMKTYSIKREIEDDMLYEDGLARGLDKKGDFMKELQSREKDLLYEKFFLSEITQKIDITPDEIMNYYQANKDKYPNTKLEDATPIIRNTILDERRSMMHQRVADSLRSVAKIEINQNLVSSASKPKGKK